MKTVRELGVGCQETGPAFSVRRRWSFQCCSDFSEEWWNKQTISHHVNHILTFTKLNTFHSGRYSWIIGNSCVNNRYLVKTETSLLVVFMPASQHTCIYTSFLPFLYKNSAFKDMSNSRYSYLGILIKLILSFLVAIWNAFREVLMCYELLE